MTKKSTPLLLFPLPPPPSIVSLARANGPKHGRRTKMLQQRKRKRTSIFRTDTTTKSANRFDNLFCISWMLSLHFYTINPLLKIQLVYRVSKKFLANIHLWPHAWSITEGYYSQILSDQANIRLTSSAQVSLISDATVIHDIPTNLETLFFWSTCLRVPFPTNRWMMLWIYNLMREKGIVFDGSRL